MKRFPVHMMLLAALAVVTSPARAQDGGTEDVFSLGAGSRAIGMGRSVVSNVDDASAVYWNPAALPSVPRPEFALMYMPLFGDFTGADYTFAGLAWPTMRAGAFGAGFLRVGTSFDGYDELSRPTGEASYSETQLVLSWGYEQHVGWLAGRAAAGASAKITRIAVEPYASTAPAADLGLRWVPDALPELAVGLNFQNILAAEHRLDVTGEDTPLTVLAGAGYTHAFGNGSTLQFLAQLDFPGEAGTRTHLGAEYRFSHYLSLRAGYDDGDLAFGLGVTVRNFGFDYAMFTRDTAGSSHPVTFSARFGESVAEQSAELAARRTREDEELIRRAWEARADAHRTRARESAAADDWDRALDEWQIVLEYVPDDAEAASGAEVARDSVIAAQAEAVRDAEKAAIIRTRFAHGLDAFATGDWLDARSDWNAILAVDSTHAGALDYRARTEAKIDDAVAAHAARAAELERAGRLTEAIAEWNNVQQYDPDNAAARTSIARIRERIETASRSLAQTQRDLRVVTLYNEGLGQYNTGEYGRAIATMDELLAMKPDHEDARRLRALAHRKLTPLTVQEKEEIRSIYLRGMQFFSRDEYESAIAEWKKILEIDPTNESVQKNIDEARRRMRSPGGQD